MKKSNLTEMKMTAENQFEQSNLLLHDKVAVIFGAGGVFFGE
jgi:hypothetical protein